MARTSQESKRRMAGPEPADAEAALPQDGDEANDKAGEGALVVELSDIGQAELSLADEVSSEPLHGLHLVSGDGGWRFPRR